MRSQEPKRRETGSALQKAFARPPLWRAPAKTDVALKPSSAG